MSNKNNYKIFDLGGFSAIGGFLFGYDIAVMSGVLIMSDFQTAMNISTVGNEFNSKVGGIVSVLLVGCFFGSLLGGQFSDRFSRKYSISIFSVVCTIGVAIQITSGIFAKTISGLLIQLLIGCFITGKSITHLFFCHTKDVFCFFHSRIFDKYLSKSN